ncbi:MAG: 3-deoxy-manno-octulosonate cytidylyltransferase [Pseudomonadota bacterium]
MNDKKKIAAVIPARMGSTRFPGKPLAMIKGLPMIEHVRRRALLSRSVDQVYVATCDQEILQAVQANGGQAIMTDAKHERCTDRVEEASRSFDADIIVIISGDEPLLLPEIIDSLLEPYQQNEEINCINLLSTIRDENDLYNKDVVKAVMDKNNNILFFSRSAIPYLRVKKDFTFYRQTGIQAFTRDFLIKFSGLSSTPMEIAESIDFLRILEHGYQIKGVPFSKELCAVDRPGDVAVVETFLEQDPAQKKYHERIMKT